VREAFRGHDFGNVEEASGQALHFGEIGRRADRTFDVDHDLILFRKDLVDLSILLQLRVIVGEEERLVDTRSQRNRCEGCPDQQDDGESGGDLSSAIEDRRFVF
jgi:hypothetical protein